MLRVLSIDGGGIRGILPALLLAELERSSERRIVDLFDLVVGTSTGGILGLALTCPRGGAGPRSAIEIGSIYLDRGETIFPLGSVPFVGLPPKGSRLFGVRTPLAPGASLSQRWKHLMGYENIEKLAAPFGGNTPRGNARYPSEPLEHELKAQLGDALMSQAILPIAVVSCDFDHGTPLIFRGGGLIQDPLGDVEMWRAARATSAAPTFFQPFTQKGVDGVIRRCVDGGLIANDPAFVAYTEAITFLKLSGRVGEPILLVSLGTGVRTTTTAPEPDVADQLLDRRAWPLLAPQLLQSMSGGPGELTREQLAQLLGPDYIRIQTTLPAKVDHAMDNASPGNVAALRATAEQLIADQRPTLTALVAALRR